MGKDTRLFKVFLDVQHGLPRQGPGSDESTRQAVSLCRGLPESPAILDIGCGPGMQTVTLAKALGGQTAAVDNHREYLRELKGRSRVEGVGARIQPLAGDMSQLPFRGKSFDLIWSEGAAYIMGFEQALADWRWFLKSGGCIGVTELVWLRPHPPSALGEFFGREYPAMSDVDTILMTFQTSGYDLLDHFTLPDLAWWEHYYRPLEAKLPRLYELYAGDDEALEVVAMAGREIEMRRLYPDWYGYEFFIAQKAD